MTKPIALLVDDVSDLLSVMAEVFEHSFPEFELITATSALAAERAIQERASDGVSLALVVTDQSLGDRTGLELLQDLQRHGAPVLVLISGRASEDLVCDAAKIGATVLWKPFRMSAFVDHVRGALRDASSAHRSQGT
ncbi:MAG: response regulator [Deltaproteobacteria bacterium]|nr:MAG: response regulator [Deltaproteobacteria bacterium]